jgi:hypothetical protein
MPTAQELADLKARELDAICVNESELKSTRGGTT